MALFSGCECGGWERQLRMQMAGRSEWENGGWRAIIAKGGVVLGSALNIGYYITMYREKM